MFRHVLLGLDFSPQAQRALDEAIVVCKRHGGRLTILTAIPEARGWAAGPCESVTAANELNAQLERDACRLQRDVVERVPADLPVATIIRREGAGRALLDQLRAGHHDALVLGASTAGRIRCGRSLTRRLIRRGGVAVLVAADPPVLHLPPSVEPAPAVGKPGHSALDARRA